jgi:NAD(P)-dependent dehydrogenase (short-subunit alcohol dehydrogenase family)
MKNPSVAIVTGASQGIGRATALRLARDFSAVVLAARNKDELEQTAEAVNAAGAEPLICPLDLREPESAKTLVKSALDRFGRIDALLNIAGAVPQIDLFEMTDAQWDDGAALKLHGARRLTIQAWDALKASNGSVVLISGRVRRGSCDQRSDHRAGKGLRRAGHQRWSAGEQCRPRRSHDRAKAILLPEVGARAQSHGGRSNEEISGRSRHRPLRKTGRDC